MLNVIKTGEYIIWANWFVFLVLQYVVHVVSTVLQYVVRIVSTVYQRVNMTHMLHNPYAFST